VPSNSWALGTMYRGGTFNGVPGFFTQSAPFQPVFPQLPQGAPWPEFPGPSQMVFSYGPWIGIGCLHWVHEFNIIRDFDYTTGESVALLTCPVCSYIQRAVEPFEAILDPNLYAVIAC